MGDRQGLYMVLIRRPEEKTQLESLGVGGMIILIGSARRGMGAWTLLNAVVNL